jgi:hypothetical protein
MELWSFLSDIQNEDSNACSMQLYLLVFYSPTIRTIGTYLARVQSNNLRYVKKVKNKPLIKPDVKTLSKGLNNRIISIYHQSMTTSKNTLLQIEKRRKG